MKYLKDFQPGRIYRFRSTPLSTEEIISFAREWHPQRLHTDEAYATGSHGGLIASSFQTMLQVFKPVMHEMMTGAGNIDGLGLEELRWPRPTPPGEALDIALEVNSASRSAHSRSSSIAQSTCMSLRKWPKRGCATCWR